MALFNSLISTLDGQGGQLLALLVIWATLLMGFAWILDGLLRRTSSAVRYCVWQFALMGLLIIPSVFVLLPGVPLGFSWKPAGTAQLVTAVVSPTAQPILTAVPLSSAPGMTKPTFSAGQQTKPRAQMVGPSRSESEKVTPAVSSTPLVATKVALPRLLAAVWAMGVVAQVAWLALCLRRAGRLARGAVPLADERVMRIQDDLENRLLMSRPTRALVSSESWSPAVMGIRRPTILLPIDIENWSDDKIRIVLSHELAHVERRDVAWQLVARAAAALYWFHPLVWLAVRRMRQERERACDDRVLAAGVQAVDYAAGLVEVAAALVGRPAPSVAAIGMAEQLSLEDRVRSILDCRAPRTPASSRVRRLLLVATAAVVLVLGIVRPFSPLRGDTTEAPAAKNEATTKADDVEKASVPPADVKSAGASNDSKTLATTTNPDETATKGSMLVRVVGPDGQPSPGANIQASVWTDEKDFKHNQYYTCDKNGQVEIRLPKTLSILRVWASKPRFVPLFVQVWAKKFGDVGPLPDDYTFHLQEATAMGGIVKNDDGLPIKGARVEVRYVQGGVKNPAATRERVSSLTDGFNTIRTDAEGRWTLRNLPPGDDVEVEVKLSHPDYLSDATWGKLQTEQDVTAQSLRAQTAEIVMHGGRRVTGTVTTPDGKPVAEAIMIWGDRPYWEHRPQQEVRTDKHGVYRFPPLPPGPMAVTVVAEGWMPERRKIAIAADTPPVDFKLQPGKTLKIRFVDPAGAPVPDVHVSIKGWRRAESLYNYDHSNVLPTKIPRQADGHGVYEWTWAPDDAVEYSFYAKGTARQLSATITADGQEHVVTMQRQLHVSGTVKDANTGRPIEQFTAVPIIYFRPDFPSVEHNDARHCTAGKLEFDFDRADVQHGLQIEAAGYTTVRVGPYALGSEVPELELRMTPAERMVGRVVDESGRPVAKARVFVGSYSEHLYLSDFDKDDGGRDTNYRVTTNGAGEFEIANQLERYCLVVVSPAGYGEVDRQPGKMPGEVRARRWAKASGRLLQAGKPVGQWNVQLAPIREQGGDAPRGHIGLYAKTANDGGFIFERVPPVPCRVEGSIHWSVDGPLSSSRSLPIDPQPGEELTLALGGIGAEVTGQLALAPDPGKDFDYHFAINYLVARRPGVTPPQALADRGFDWREGWSDSWASSSEGTAYLHTLHHHFVKPDPDGHFRISGVEPGDYDLAFRLYGSTEGCLVHPVGLAVVRVQVKDGQSVLDLGKIMVPALSAPKVGDTAPDFEFTSVDGRKQKLSDYRGKYVLVDFWATWCGPCVAKIGEVESLRLKYAGQPGLVVVGANLDQDPRRAKDFLSDRKLPWQHALLGDWSSTDVPRRFAVSSVPTYVLLDTDGRIADHESSLDAIAAHLEAATKRPANK